MATFQVNSITLTDEQKAQISSDGSGITFHVVYDPTPPAGYQVIATGNLGSMVACAKPCFQVVTQTS